MTGILLSKLELDMLRNPEKLNARQKRNLSYRLKTRGSEIGKALQELELLINNVPEEALMEAVSNETFFSLKAILEKLLQIRAPWPVGVDEKGEGVRGFKVYGKAIPSTSTPKECTISSISREATYEEVELDYHLTELHNNLRQYVDPCTPDPASYALSEDPYQALKSLGVYKFREALNENLSINIANYEDEVGVDEHLWVVRKPSMVDIAQLSWMRWKPRDLKECLELPPLLKEKNFTVNWKEEASISNSSSPEEIERFREVIQKRNQAPKLTEEQLAEINRKLNSS